MDEIVGKARNFATQAHRRIEHRRKRTLQPYEVHLKAVAELVKQAGGDPEMIAAAWLHDLVDDTPATLDDVERAFGQPVAELVEQLTNVSRPSDGNRARRAAIDREHSARASPRAKTIKLADLIDNTRDICRHDPSFARTFLSEVAVLVEVLGQGDGRLLRRARELVRTCSERLGLGKAPAGRVGDAHGWSRMDRDLAARYPRELRRFARTFHAQDLVEPLPPDHPSASTRFKAGQIVPGDAPLSDVVEVLTRHDHCLVGREGRIDGVIERRDVGKPVARMWLFGLVTLTELYLTDRIRGLWSDNAWIRLLSPARLRRAEELRAERLRRQQPCELLDCLQLADKGAILLRNPVELAAFGFESARAGELALRDLQSLRNNLAHAQDTVGADWPQIVRLARRLESLVVEA